MKLVKMILTNKHPSNLSANRRDNFWLDSYLLKRQIKK